MICPSCSGNGYVTVDKKTKRWLPCFRCNGSGVAHCCDGDQPSEWEKNETHRR